MNYVLSDTYMYASEVILYVLVHTDGSACCFGSQIARIRYLGLRMLLPLHVLPTPQFLIGQ